MKILLVNPPQTYYPQSRSAVASVPLGLLSIAAGLEQAGHAVEVIDFLVADVPPRHGNGIIQVGAAWEDIEEQLAKSQPDVIGISIPFSTQVENAVKTARLARRSNPNALVVIGGPHASVRAAESLEEMPEVDIAVIGEGEFTMRRIVEHRASDAAMDDIPGIAFRRAGGIITTGEPELITDLDSLPRPAYHLVDMETYLAPKRIRYRETRFRRELPMITSRGCPFNCIFCSIHLHMGKRWRSHSAGYVLAHLEHLVSRYGVQHIHFEDDNLTLNINRLNEIIDGIIGKDLPISWDTPNGVRAEKLTVDILKRLQRSGCTGLTIGIESGDQGVLDTVIDKSLKLDDVITTARNCKKVGLPLSAFFVIGFPGETLENMENTVNYAIMLRKKYGVDMELFTATPLWGTRLYELCRSKGYLTRELSPRVISESIQFWGEGLIKTDDFSPEEVKNLAARAVHAHNRLRLFSYLKNPVMALRLARAYPQDALRFIKSIFGR